MAKKTTRRKSTPKAPAKAKATPAKEAQPKRRKIAIIGTAPSSFKLAPYDDPTWEVWALKVWNAPRWDVFFEIHPHESGMQRWPKEYKEWLVKEHKDDNGELKPNFTQGKVSAWPNSRPYPLSDVLKHYGLTMAGKDLCTYFTNQVSYMIALAAMQHQPANGVIVSDIGLWGVDMAQHGVGGRSEYAHQRPSCEYFLGYAAGMGINLHIPDQSDLLKCRKLYAFEQDDFTEKLKAREKELRTRLNKIDGQANQAQREGDHLRGALEDVTWQQQWQQVGMT